MMAPSRAMASYSQRDLQVWHGLPHSWRRGNQFQRRRRPPSVMAAPSGQMKRQKNF